MMVRLDEANDFEFVPKTVRRDITEFAESFSSTWVIELGVGQAKKTQEQSPNDNAGQREVWASLVGSGLLEEHDHKQPTITNEVKDHANGRSLKKAFDPDPEASCFDEEDLRGIASDNWYCPQPEGFRHIGVYTELALQIGTQTKLVEKTWMALFMTPFTIVQKRGATESFIVCHVNHRAVVAWRLQPRICNLSDGTSFRWLELSRSGEEACFKVLLVTDHREWRASMALGLSQKHIEKLFVGVPMHRWPNGGAIVCSGGFVDLDQLAASHGFVKMTIPHMKNAIEDYGIKHPHKKAPKTADQHVECLLRHIKSPLSDDELARVLALRKSRAAKEAAASVDGTMNFLHGNNLKIMKDLVDEDEYKQ